MSECGDSFQDGVTNWLVACFGEVAATDRAERTHRFLEEALEFGQALGCTREEALQLVDYVFGRPPGEPVQEAGGVLLTLAGACHAHSLDMQAAGNAELARVWEKRDAIRRKHAARPHNSPLPGPSDAS